MNKCISFVLIFLWVFGNSSGQTFKSSKQIRGFDLTSESIYAINQDANGFIWLATDKGVRYSDGISMKLLPEELLLQSYATQLLTIDQDGHVWIYQSRGKPVVYYYDLSAWHRIPLSIAKDVEESNQSNTQLYIGGSGKEKSLFLVVGDQLVVQDMAGELIRKYDIDIGSFGRFTSIFTSAEGELHFVFNKCVFKLTDDTFEEVTLSTENLPEPVLQVVYNDLDSSYYYLSKNSLYKSDRLGQIDGPIFYGFSGIINSEKDSYGLFENNGDLYFFYNSQLYKRNFRSKAITELSVSDELNVNYVQSTFVDREGATWLGTYRGAAILSSLRFQSFDKRIGLPETDISAIHYLAPTTYILGYNNGYQIWDGTQILKSVEFSDPYEAKLNRVMNFSRDKFGKIWFGAYKTGLGFIDPESFDWQKVSLPTDEPVNYVEVREDSLFVITHNHLWKAPIDENGPTAPFEEYLENITQQEGFSGNFIRKTGKIQDKWIILDNGENTYSNDPDIGLSYIRISGYDYLLRNDTLLIATEDGLFFLEDDKLKLFSLNGDTVRNPVYTILEDDQARLWLGTNFGVFVLENNRIRQFNERNGLIGNEVSRGALQMAGAGRIFIGTQNGVSVYIPEEDNQRITAPKTYIEKITVVSDVSIPTSTSNIPYAYNNVSVDYRAVSFASWPYLTVSYKLIGLHDEWRTIENPRENRIYFNNLPPGEYQLMLKSSLGQQVNSEVTYADPFTVNYPYYLQGWFIALVVIVFVGLGILLNFLFVQFRYQGVLKSDLARKKVEIKKTEDQFKNVWNSSVDGLMLSVAGGIVIAANPALCRLAGVKEEELIENGLSFLFRDPTFYQKERATMLAEIERMNGSGFKREMRMPFKSGDKEVELFIARMQSDFEDNAFLLNIFRDISQKKEYEEGLKLAKDRAEEVSMLKSSILANMSHEIRTPLNGILGSAENILGNIQDQPHLASQVQIIQESGERLLHTINAILDLSKIQSDKRDINYEVTNINDFFSKILLPHKSSAIKKGILVTVKHRTKPFVGNIEREYITMIINHVVGNAIKYSNEGVVTIEIEKKGENLFLKVTDQGIGIGEEYLDKLFSPFEQESNGYDRKFEGAGLGLAVTKQLLDQLSGTIDIKSTKGKGTEVIIEIPLFT
ncbi:sensor histidine kinase [Lunatibacter salilacus]|uniref:sensor histidine kinase n=1 Tax=Lunatibacter salilacus TaxID=2483804 RepID=UPI00131BC65A|nr:ATP-binding protein [Lunatibacter salilacus]